MERVIKKLIEDNKTISTMESCTGGGIANAITNIPDASRVIKYSAVTYSNEFKIKMGVSEELINKYSVYSMEVARDMAKKISMYTSSTYGVGVTGKLKKYDPNNLNGEDDVVFLSIYYSLNNEYHDTEIKVHYDTREENKQEVIDTFVSKFLEMSKDFTR